MPVRMASLWMLVLAVMLLGCEAASPATGEMPTSTPAPRADEFVYLAHETGFMLRAVDEACAYAFSDATENIVMASGFDNAYLYCLPADSASDAAFAEVWNRYEVVQQALGQPIAEPEHFTGTIPPGVSAMNSVRYSLPFAPLPDGRALWCGIRAATAGTCDIR